MARGGRLQGKRAIVTGAASGIGRAAARRFAEEGAQVLAADVETAGLADTADGTSIETLRCDAGDESSVRELVDAAVRRFGGLDVVYANAGISGTMTPFWDVPVEEFESILRVNLIGPFLALKHAREALIDAGRASFIATASVAGLRSGAGPTPYSASKAGVISLVQTAAYQLYGTGVRVNALCPGLTETGMTRPLFDAARERGNEGRIGQLNPLARAGQPEEIAATALFLASDEASYVNGQAIAVCGGLSASHPFVPGHLA